MVASVPEGEPVETVPADGQAGPLGDLRVVELAQGIAAAYCAKLLADLGAEVLKVEPLTGDATRHHGPFPDDVPDPERSGLFRYLNTNKLGVTLNLESATGRGLFLMLLGDADALIEDQAPGQMEAWQLDGARLTATFPRLVATSITPFGQSGPYRDWKGTDLTCQAIGGMSDVVGEPGRAPLRLPLGQTHYQAGAHAAAATLVALFARRTTGAGQHVDVSETDVWATFHQPGRVHMFVRDGRVRRRSGHRTPGFYPYTILPCRDGYVSLIAGRGSQWKAFLELLGGGEVPAWYADEPRFRDRLAMSWRYADELDSLIAPWLMSHTKEEIFAACQARRIPFAAVYSADEVLAHPHLDARGYFTVDEPSGAALPGAPYQLSATLWAIRRPAPRLGEHNVDVFVERLGLSRVELVELRRCGVA